ncbi:MAG: serine/threonine-protein kinase, partial [Polyangiales bacterium]
MDAKVCIAGKYRLEEKIGEGGMATVWRAIQEPLDRPVAIKFLHATGRHDLSEMQQRFLSEAKVAAAVHHRNVVNILDFGTTEVGEPFMVMELLEGESLHARLLRDEPMPLTELIRIVTLTLRGLRAVHDAAIVHRDLKPENIFLVRDADGVFPKLLDFGISRSTRGGLGGLRSAVRTEDGLIIGTPQYMSPEQARGCPDIDKRTDIYAVGVILYEALTGRLPFEAEHPGDLLIKIATGERIPVEVIRPDIRPPLAAVINRALEHDRAQRFPNAQAMQKALQKAVAKERGLRGWSQLSSSMAPPWNASLQPMSLAPAAAQLATVPRQSPDAALLESAPTVAT